MGEADGVQMEFPELMPTHKEASSADENQEIKEIQWRS